LFTPVAWLLKLAGSNALMSVKTGLAKDGPPETVNAFCKVAPAGSVEE
jgi:hypothetical protein